MQQCVAEDYARLQCARGGGDCCSQRRDLGAGRRRPNDGPVVGEPTAKVEQPKTRPIMWKHLVAPVFHILHIPQDLHYKNPSGRPVPMIDGGKAIAKLI